MSSSERTLYFLQASRSIRIAWLLEELTLPYDVIAFPRVENKAPADFAAQSGNHLGKAPTLKDAGLLLTESGAIAEYLVEKYDGPGRLNGRAGDQGREKVRMWCHAAEGTFMVHALAVTYARWNASEAMKERGELKAMEQGLGVNVGRDLDWLERELGAGTGWLVGDGVSLADIMVLFSIQFIFARDLSCGRTVDEWPRIGKWLERCEGTASWKKAVEKTGHEL